MKKAALFVSIALCLILLSTTAFAWGEIKRSKGQTVYVPATSIKVGDHQYSYTKVIIRNIDPNNSITVNSVKFYDPNGDFVREFLDEPVTVEHWESLSHILISGLLEGDPIYAHDEGRPFFIVEWQADNWVIPSSIVASQGYWTNTLELRGWSKLQGIVIKEKWPFGEWR